MCAGSFTISRSLTVSCRGGSAKNRRALCGGWEPTDDRQRRSRIRNTRSALLDHGAMVEERWKPRRIGQQWRFVTLGRWGSIAALLRRWSRRSTTTRRRSLRAVALGRRITYMRDRIEVAKAPRDLQPDRNHKAEWNDQSYLRDVCPHR
jgi:hypothetical protein